MLALGRMWARGLTGRSARLHAVRAIASSCSSRRRPFATVPSSPSPEVSVSRDDAKRPVDNVMTVTAMPTMPVSSGNGDDAAGYAAHLADSEAIVSTEESELFDVTHTLQTILGLSFNSGRILIVGEQGSGKTSLLEAITGVQDVFPVSARIGTRRPTGIVLKRTPKGTPLHAQFTVEGNPDGPPIYDIDSIRRRITAANSVKGVSPEPINLSIHGEDLPIGIIMVDTCGYCRMNEDGPNVPDEIVAINRRLLEDPRNIIVLIEAANVDEMTQQARAEVYRADPNGERLLIVKSKFDLTSKGDDNVTLQTLQNKPHPKHNPKPPRYGVVGVRCRTHKDIEQKRSLADVEMDEYRFNKSKGWLDKSKRVNVGIPVLKRTLTRISHELIAQQTPEVLPELRRIIDERLSKRALMKELLEGRDVRTIASEIEAIANALNENSDDREYLERRLSSRLTVRTRENFAEATKQMPPDFSMTSSAEQVMPTSYFNDNFVRTAAGLLSLCRADPIPPKPIPGVPGAVVHSPATLEGFRELTAFHGHGAFDNVTNATMESVQHAVVSAGASAAFVRVKRVDEFARRARRTWMDSVYARVQHSLDKLGYVDAVINVFLEELKDALSRVKIHGSSQPSRLGLLFCQELIDNIFRSTLEEGLRHKLTGILELEQRAELPATAVFRHLVTQLGKAHTVSNTSKWNLPFFSKLDNPVAVTMHGPEWDRAAEEIRCEQVASRVARTFNLQVVDPLLRNTVVFTLNTFASDNTVKEQQRKEDEEIAQLEHCYDYMKRHAERYTRRAADAAVAVVAKQQPGGGEGAATSIVPATPSKPGIKKSNAVWLERASTTLTTH